MSSTCFIRGPTAADGTAYTFTLRPGLRYSTGRPVRPQDFRYALERVLDLNPAAASFLDAIAEGNDPTAADKTTVDEQVSDRAIRVFVYNSQNSTPDVQRVLDAARKEGIPVTKVTETLTPAGATFQAWQVRQLGQLRAALARAAGPA